MNIEWLSKILFDEKLAPLRAEELSAVKSFLGEPLTEAEIVTLKDLPDASGHIKYLDWELPCYTLPDEFIELLKYSNGNFCNDDREIGLFSLEDFRDYYLLYMFPEFQPGAIPFGFNGGGTFYAYDLRTISNSPSIIATSSRVLNWDEAVLIGHSLEEGFSKSTDIDDEYSSKVVT